MVVYTPSSEAGLSRREAARAGGAILSSRVSTLPRQTLRSAPLYSTQTESKALATRPTTTKRAELVDSAQRITTPSLRGEVVPPTPNALEVSRPWKNDLDISINLTSSKAPSTKSEAIVRSIGKAAAWTANSVIGCAVGVLKGCGLAAPADVHPVHKKGWIYTRTLLAQIKMMAEFGEITGAGNHPEYQKHVENSEVLAQEMYEEYAKEANLTPTERKKHADEVEAEVAVMRAASKLGPEASSKELGIAIHKFLTTTRMTERQELAFEAQKTLGATFSYATKTAELFLSIFRFSGKAILFNMNAEARKDARIQKKIAERQIVAELERKTLELEEREEELNAREARLNSKESELK
jgi:hypothetical protein